MLHVELPTETAPAIPDITHSKAKQPATSQPKTETYLPHTNSNGESSHSSWNDKNLKSAGSNAIRNEVVSEIEELKLRALDRTALAKRNAELDRLRNVLLEEKKKLQTQFKISFRTSPDFVGYIIGKNGSNVARAESIPDVRRVDVKDCEVTIFANTYEAAETARDLLEIESLVVPVTPAERNLIVGRGGKNIRDLQVTEYHELLQVHYLFFNFVQSKSGLVKLQIDDKGNIHITGK